MSSIFLALCSLTTSFGVKKIFDTHTHTLAQFLKLKPVFDLDRFAWNVWRIWRLERDVLSSSWQFFQLLNLLVRHADLFAGLLQHLWVCVCVKEKEYGRQRLLWVLRTVKKRKHHPTRYTLFEFAKWVMDAIQKFTSEIQDRNKAALTWPPSLSESAINGPFECCEQPKKIKSPHILHSKACCTKTGISCCDVDCKISRSDPGRSFGNHNI